MLPVDAARFHAHGDDVRAEAGDDRVVAAVALDGVGALGGDQQVVAVVAGQEDRARQGQHVDAGAVGRGVVADVWPARGEI